MAALRKLSFAGLEKGMWSELLSEHAKWLWSVALGIALFFPVRRLIWVLSVRRDERKTGQPSEEFRRQALKKRADIIAALLCFVFAVLYVHVVFSRVYGTPSP